MRWHELVHASLLARSGISHGFKLLCAFGSNLACFKTSTHHLHKAERLKEIKWSLNWIVSLIGLLPASSFWSWKELQKVYPRFVVTEKPNVCSGHSEPLVIQSSILLPFWAEDIQRLYMYIFGGMGNQCPGRNLSFKTFSVFSMFFHM